MWTGKFSRYFMVLLCASSFNAAWAQEDVKKAKYYFSEYKESSNAQAPTLSVGGDVPVDATVSAEGFVWASSYRETSFSYPNCEDRVFAQRSSDKKSTSASLTFNNFKYEVKKVEWNIMNDVFAAKLSDLKSIFSIKGTIKSATNQIRSGSKNAWAVFGHSVTFNVANMPETPDEIGFNGLSLIKVEEKNIGLIFKTPYEINDKNRFFFKAGSATDDFAFQVTYYDPSVSFAGTMPSQIKFGETGKVQYTINHPGLFNFTTTYESSDENIFTVDENGVITPKNLGKANIIVTITDGGLVKTGEKEIEIISPTLGENQYVVALKYNDGTDRGETVIVTYSKDMPTVTPPTRTGYIFRGYYDGKDYSQTEDWANKYYNADGTSARQWDKNNNATLYAHWTAKTYTINFNTCGGRLSENVGIRTEGGQKFVETTNDQTRVSFDVQYGSTLGDRFWCGDVITIRPGYKFLGWYTLEKGGKQVYTVNDNDCSFNAVKGPYWTEEGTSGKWRYDATSVTLNLYAQYECKFEIVDDGERINFKEGYDIITQDIDAAIKEDNDVYHTAPLVIDITKYPKFIETGSSGFVSSKGEHFNSGEQAFNTALEDAREESKLAPNALVYLSKESSLYTTAKNVVMMKEEKCLNLVVTDRAPIKVPYAFKANNALYERNKDYSSEDAAKAQAANSQWGTLCLPYPIRNNANNVKFYKLAGFEKSVMHYTPMNVDVIPANTPVLYKRLEGVGSEVKIEEAGVNVPVNTSYSTNPGSSLDSWQFIGTLTTKIFCGKDYDNKKVPAGAEKMDGSKEIYYFKQDQFTHLANKGKVTMLPYRAYFTTTAANAKFTTFSIIAIDEEGATDITNLIDNDAEGDGKIYDLNGRRVMQPVSGRLYIVNGKKKVY